MRTMILASAIAVAFLAGAPAVSASDTPIKGPTYKTSVYNWTGLYGGVHAGYGFGQTKDNVFGGVDIDTTGFIGGVQFSYLSDMSIWVFGIEADIALGNRSGETNFFGATFKHTYKHESTVRAIFGIPMNNGRLLPYGTIGVAFAKTQLDIAPFGLTSKDNYTGISWGAGVRWAYTDNVSIDLSYIVNDYGSQAAFGFPNAADAQTQTLKLAVNYRFAWSK